MNITTDEQRKIEYLEQRVQALYNEAARLPRDEELNEYAKSINSIARDLEMYVDRLKKVLI